MTRGGILLATINAKWIHPSLALRLLKANLGPLSENCEIVEFALRQPLREKLEPILESRPRILGLSVSIWNLTATVELLKELAKIWDGAGEVSRPFVVLGGPEVSYLPTDAEIFEYADYCVRGEGEIVFGKLCDIVFSGKAGNIADLHSNGECAVVDLGELKSGYALYTDEDLQRKLTYVEASRGCPYSCGFCLSANHGDNPKIPRVREFPLEPFLREMNELITRGAKTFKFLDRSFNLDIARANRIMDFFLDRLAVERSDKNGQYKPPFTVHFEMVPSRFPPELIQTIARFPPGSLRLEIGIQTLNPDVSSHINRLSDPPRELEILRRLRSETNAIIHADLIAGLPSEDMVSFGNGFDILWEALFPPTDSAKNYPLVEVQLGILKLLPGAPIARHSEAFGMRYDTKPPYEVTETAAISARDLGRIKNFARFWELIVNRGIADVGPAPIFDRFMALSDLLLARFGRNWGIAKADLLLALHEVAPTYGLRNFWGTA